MTVIAKETVVFNVSKVVPKTKKGEDKLLLICSYVAEKTGGCWEELTCGNVKFHSLFNSYLSTLNQSLDYFNALI